MPNYRLLVNDCIQSDSHITLDKNHSQHICKVLRLKSGDEISVFNSMDGEYLATIIDDNPKAALIQVSKQIHPAPIKPKCYLHLGQVISRGDRMDYSIQKATELGVHEITPILSQRCGVQIAKERLIKRMQHWQGVIDSAVQQCGRLDTPKLNNPITLDQWITQQHPGLCLAALVNSDNNPIQEVKDKPSQVNILIGPEGGFTEQEEALMKEHTFLAWQLGPRVLRTETAGVVALTLLQNQFGDFTEV